MEDGSIDQQAQPRILRASSAEGFEEAGFRATLEAAEQAADEGCKAALSELLTQLLRRCQVVTAFTRSAPCFYGPCEGVEISSPPAWWEVLTVERWSRLLEGNLPVPAVIELRCSHALPVPGFGQIGIVEDSVVLAVELPPMLRAMSRS
jgi:hypothetical protein